MVKLSKQDVAERLRVQAVKLQFSDGDPLAIHLLIMSALRICRDVCALDNSVVDEFQKFIMPGKQKEFFNIFYSIASFSKHADRDHDSLLDFSPDLPQFNAKLIMLVDWTFQRAFKVPTKNIIVHAANLYHRKLYPNIILPVSDDGKNIDQQLGLLDTTAMHDLIRKLVKEGPSFLGSQTWINEWTW